MNSILLIFQHWQEYNIRKFVRDRLTSLSTIFQLYHNDVWIWQILSPLLFTTVKLYLSACSHNYCPFDITQKDDFCLAFYLKWNYFVLIDHILSKPFVVSVFRSQIYTLKLNLRPKIGLTYAISIVKWLFGIFVLENIFYFSLNNDLNNWWYITIFWKFQKNWIRRTCWKSASKLSTL